MRRCATGAPMAGPASSSSIGCPEPGPRPGLWTDVDPPAEKRWTALRKTCGSAAEKRWTRCGGLLTRQGGAIREDPADLGGVRGHAQGHHELDARLGTGQVLPKDDAHVLEHAAAALVAVG